MALQEQREHARPAIAGELPDLSGYDTIFFGSPVWWGDWPMIYYTFFESVPLSGKTLIPFTTHAGSGLAGFDRSLAAQYPDCTVAKGLAVAGTDAQNHQDKVQTAVTKLADRAWVLLMCQFNISRAAAELPTPQLMAIVAHISSSY